jgi:hypothetical protein
MDDSVANTTDVGGIGDLLGNASCETAGPRNPSCAATLQSVSDAIAGLGKAMSASGVKHVVLFFYPHLDPAGGGWLPSPAPAINDAIDDGYRLAEQLCCGTTFVSSEEDYTCKGNALGPECMFVDTRPAFEGHTGDYLSGADHVNPSPTGSTVLAALLWWAMVDNCIAQ